MIPATFRYGLFGLYTLAVMFFMFGESSAQVELWRMVTLIPFVLFAVAPIALLCFVPLYRDAQLIVAVPIAAFGIWAYYETIYVAAPDAQSALVFVFAPFWQFILAGIALAIIAIGDRLLRNWK